MDKVEPKPMKRILVTVLTVVGGCASTPGARPDESSVAGHEQMAQQHEAEGAAVAENCRRGVPPAGSVCWTSTGSPTPETLKQEARHRRMAADHRAASQALRDAEAQACAGIPEQDRDMSPFEHREDIARVEPIEMSLGGKVGGFRMTGVTIEVRAVPGMTAEWLQRVVDCHIARNASMGYAMPEMSDCPLMLKNVTATVTSTGRGFAVAVRSADVGTLREVQRRAEALRSSPRANR
jgi:hypothetical protein